jgi:heptosyltransferase-3
MHKKILIYNSGGGLGDAIQLFPLLTSLKKSFKDTKIFYLSAHKNHFEGRLKEYNVQVENINLGLKYFGFRWLHLLKVKKIIKEKKIHTFDLIIDLQSKLRNTLILKQIPSRYFYSSTYNYFFCGCDVNGFHFKKIVKNNNGIHSIISNLTFFLNNTLETIEYSVEKIQKEYHDEAKRLLPKNNYIGFSVTQGNEYRKKSWSINNFILLANKYILNGKKVVFFIEKSEVDLIKYIKKEIPSSLFPEHNSDIACPALVTALSARLEKAITIDNGIMHMIGLSNVPMIVLFGPTNAKKFAPKKSNVTILDSKKMYASTDINKITVEDVLKNSLA